MAIQRRGGQMGGGDDLMKQIQAMQAKLPRRSRSSRR